MGDNQNHNESDEDSVPELEEIPERSESTSISRAELLDAFTRQDTNWEDGRRGPKPTMEEEIFFMPRVMDDIESLDSEDMRTKLGAWKKKHGLSREEELNFMCYFIQGSAKEVVKLYQGEFDNCNAVIRYLEIKHNEIGGVCTALMEQIHRGECIEALTEISQMFKRMERRVAKNEADTHNVYFKHIVTRKETEEALTNLKETENTLIKKVTDLDYMKVVHKRTLARCNRSMEASKAVTYGLAKRLTTNDKQLLWLTTENNELTKQLKEQKTEVAKLKGEVADITQALYNGGKRYPGRAPWAPACEELNKQIDEMCIEVTDHDVEMIKLQQRLKLAEEDRQNIRKALEKGSGDSRECNMIVREWSLPTENAVDE